MRLGSMVMVVFEFPALLKVAVSMLPVPEVAPGAGLTDQLVVEFHAPSDVPFHVPLAACAEAVNAARKAAAEIAMRICILARRVFIFFRGKADDMGIISMSGRVGNSGRMPQWRRRLLLVDG